MPGKILLVITASFLVLPTAAIAETGLAAKVSTLGFGVELSKSSSLLNLTGRIGAQGFNYTYDDTIVDIDYDLELQLASVSVMADWRPFGSLFYFSGGAVYNLNELDAESQDALAFQIGDNIYPADLVGTLHGNVQFDDWAPYAGIGFRFPVAPSFSLGFDAGVLFQGKPEVSLEASGPISSDQGFQQQLEQERADFEDDIEDYQYYPVVSLTFTKKF